MKYPFPFEEKPTNCQGPIWRYSKNPIIPRESQPGFARVFNSAILRMEDGNYEGIFRVEDLSLIPNLHLGRSEDGIHFQLEREPLRFLDETGHPAEPTKWSYDPRLTKIGDTYWLIFCDEFDDFPSIGMAYSKDLKTFVKLNRPFPPLSRNGALFPEKIGGKYWMLYRPTVDAGRNLDMFIASSDDLHHWGDYSLFYHRPPLGWSCLKVGAGATPIKTKRGWLVLYHGVIGTCNGYVYSMGAMLTDLEDPRKVIAVGKNYLLHPVEPYETSGFVPNVCFPCSAIVDEETGRIAIYYGAADTILALAFSTVDGLVDWVLENKAD